MQQSPPHTVPAEAEVVNLVGEQQAWLEHRFGPPTPGGPARWLSVRYNQNRLGNAAYSYTTLIGRLNKLAARVRLVDSARRLLTLTKTHMMRHTKATILKRWCSLGRRAALHGSTSRRP
jgi:hypothetical protein